MKSTLKSLVISINNTCNMRCRQCAYIEPDEKEEISVETYKQILQQAQASSVKKIRYLGLSEPTLHACFNDLLKTNCLFPDFFYHVITNGSTLGNVGIRNAFTSYPIDILEISIDAFSDEMYRYIRNGTPCIFQEIKSNILDISAKLDRTNRTKIAVSFVMHKENAHEADAFTEYWKRRVNFVYLRRPHNFSNRANGLPSQLQRCEKQQQCDFLKSKLYISSDLKIHACSFDFDGNAVLGRMDHGNSIKDAWDSDKRISMTTKRHLGINSICNYCSCASNLRIRLDNNVYLL